MNLKSLRFRLLAGGAVAVAVALVAAWFFLTLLFEHHLERRLADELQREGVRLVSGLTVGPGDSLAVAERLEERRVGTECVSTCICQWARDKLKKKYRRHRKQN